MFEQEYRRANDRIHPRKDLLKEMEAKWAAEAEQPAAEERGRIVAFPTWARYLSAAAGILLCVGVGMGSVLLFTRSGGRKYAAEAPMMAAEMAVDQEEAKILTEAADAAVYETKTTGEVKAESKPAAAYEPAGGMHPAADEAEVEDAVRYGSSFKGAVPTETGFSLSALQEAEAPTEADGSLMAGAVQDAEVHEARFAAVPKVAESPYPAGEILVRDDLMALFMPTAQQIQVIQYANKRVTKVFSLTLRQQDAQVKQIFWMGSQLLALRERQGVTELIRFDVTDWKSPRHLSDLSQSGTFLGAGEMNGLVYILSLYRAEEQEPLPWVNGARMDYENVLLDSARPADTFTVITVYDPEGGDEPVAQTALLTAARGAVIEGERLLLWAGEGETDLYVLCRDGTGLSLTSQGKQPGTVLDAGAAGESFLLLTAKEEGAALLLLDERLNGEGTAAVDGVMGVRFARVYEDGAMVLTDDAAHWITLAGDSALEATGDGFVWLTPDRGLILSAEGQIQLVALRGRELEALGTARVSDGLAALVEDPTRLAYDPAANRLVFPAGQKVYLYEVSEAGELTLRSTPLTFYDHSDAEQRELRCLLIEDRALVFYKGGVHLCKSDLERILTTKY